MRRKADSGLAPCNEQREETGQVWKVSGDRDISRFTPETIADPLRRIIGLQVARGREFGERVARAPHCFRRLLRAQLAAVPHDRRLRAVRRGAGGDSLDACDSRRRQRPSCVDLRADSVAVMDQYSSDRNASRSCSRSQINLTATDCTRPMLSPRRTFFHSNWLPW